VPVLTALPSLLRQGDLEVVSTLHQRMGDDLERAGQQDADHDERGWGRVFGGSIQVHQNGVTAPELDGNLAGFQAGLDLYQAAQANGERQHNAGFYGAFARARTEVEGMTGTTAEPGRVGSLRPEITALGAYWTYRRAPAGFYLDAIAQRSWYGGALDAVTGVASAIGGTGMLGSISFGYGIALSSGWMLEPQLQLIRQGSNIDGLAIPNAEVSFSGGYSTTGRLGLRLVGDYRADDGTRTMPYVRANLWHGFDTEQRTTFRTAAAASPLLTRMGHDTGELGAGFSRGVTERFSVHGEIDYRFDLGSGEGLALRGTSGTLGFRYYW
jgi:outer membrane autotransporter protein